MSKDSKQINFNTDDNNGDDGGFTPETTNREENNQNGQVQTKAKINMNQTKTYGKGLVNKKIEKSILAAIVISLVVAGVYEIHQYDAKKAAAAQKISKVQPTNKVSSPLPTALTSNSSMNLITPTADNISLPVHVKKQAPAPAHDSSLSNQEKVDKAQINSSGILALTGSGGAKSSSNNQEDSDSNMSELQNELAKAKEERANLNNKSNSSSNTSAIEALYSELGKNKQSSGNGNNFLQSQSGQKNEAISIHDEIRGTALQQGTVIPATLITRVDTEQPGNVIAQVNRDIYSNSGVLVIPGGSTLRGTYDTSVKNGQDRVLLAFNELIFPDGKYINLGGMTSNGPRGAAGSAGDLHNHFWSKLGSALFVALVSQGLTSLSNAAGTGASSAAGQTNNYYGNNSGQSYSAGSQVINQAVSNLMQPYENVNPNITIPQNQRIEIITTKTILFHGYKN